VKVVRITEANINLYQEELSRLEDEMTYPLGSEFFKISHGNNYLRFFQRLGDVHLYALLDGEKIAGVAGGVIRIIPDRKGRNQKTWYLCDLKIRKEYRGKGWTLRWLGRVFISKYLLCRRAYGISMNPGDGSPNKVLKLLEKFRWAKFSSAGNLHIYSLSQSEFSNHQEYLNKEMSGFSLIQLRDIKDIVMQPSQKVMDLYHLLPGESGPQNLLISNDAVIMFSLPERHPLHERLLERGLKPSASATVIHHRMDPFDWDFVRTSDI